MTHGRLTSTGREDAHPAAHRFATVEAIVPPRPWTSELWLPENFEPRYAYPLLVLLHDDGGDELADAEVANAAAEQNMFVMSVRGPFSSGAGYGWSLRESAINGTLVWRLVSEELAGLPAELNFHPERVFLAGRGAGAIAAWRAWIRHCDQIAGAALISPPSVPDAAALRDAAVMSQTKPSLTGRLWIGAGSTSSWRPTAQSAYALGAEVSLDAQAESPEATGRSLDRWVMRALPTAVFA